MANTNRGSNTNATSLSPEKSNTITNSTNNPQAGPGSGPLSHSGSGTSSAATVTNRPGSPEKPTVVKGNSGTRLGSNLNSVVTGGAGSSVPKLNLTNTNNKRMSTPTGTVTTPAKPSSTQAQRKSEPPAERVLNLNLKRKSKGSQGISSNSKSTDSISGTSGSLRGSRSGTTTSAKPGQGPAAKTEVEVPVAVTVNKSATSILQPSNSSNSNQKQVTTQTVTPKNQDTAVNPPGPPTESRKFSLEEFDNADLENNANSNSLNSNCNNKMSVTALAPLNSLSPTFCGRDIDRLNASSLMMTSKELLVPVPPTVVDKHGEPTIRTSAAMSLNMNQKTPDLMQPSSTSIRERSSSIGKFSTGGINRISAISNRFSREVSLTRSRSPIKVPEVKLPGGNAQIFGTPRAAGPEADLDNNQNNTNQYSPRGACPGPTPRGPGTPGAVTAALKRNSDLFQNRNRLSFNKYGGGISDLSGAWKRSRTPGTPGGSGGNTNGGIVSVGNVPIPPMALTPFRNNYNLNAAAAAAGSAAVPAAAAAGVTSVLTPRLGTNFKPTSDTTPSLREENSDLVPGPPGVTVQGSSVPLANNVPVNSTPRTEPQSQAAAMANNLNNNRLVLPLDLKQLNIKPQYAKIQGHIITPNLTPRENHKPTVQSKDAGKIFGTTTNRNDNINSEIPAGITTVPSDNQNTDPPQRESSLSRPSGLSLNHKQTRVSAYKTAGNVPHVVPLVPGVDFRDPHTNPNLNLSQLSPRHTEEFIRKSRLDFSQESRTLRFTGEMPKLINLEEAGFRVPDVGRDFESGMKKRKEVQAKSKAGKGLKGQSKGSKGQGSKGVAKLNSKEFGNGPDGLNGRATVAQPTGTGPGDNSLNDNKNTKTVPLSSVLEAQSPRAVVADDFGYTVVRSPSPVVGTVTNPALSLTEVGAGTGTAAHSTTGTIGLINPIKQWGVPAFFLPYYHNNASGPGAGTNIGNQKSTNSYVLSNPHIKDYVKSRCTSTERVIWTDTDGKKVLKPPDDLMNKQTRDELSLSCSMRSILNCNSDNCNTNTNSPGGTAYNSRKAAQNMGPAEGRWSPIASVPLPLPWIVPISTKELEERRVDEERGASKEDNSNNYTYKGPQGLVIPRFTKANGKILGHGMLNQSHGNKEISNSNTAGNGVPVPGNKNYTNLTNPEAIKFNFSPILRVPQSMKTAFIKNNFLAQNHPPYLFHEVAGPLVFNGNEYPEPANNSTDTVLNHNDNEPRNSEFQKQSEADPAESSAVPDSLKATADSCLNTQFSTVNSYNNTPGNFKNSSTVLPNKNFLKYDSKNLNNGSELQVDPDMSVTMRDSESENVLLLIASQTDSNRTGKSSGGDPAIGIAKPYVYERSKNSYSSSKRLNQPGLKLLSGTACGPPSKFSTNPSLLDSKDPPPANNHNILETDPDCSDPDNAMIYQSIVSNFNLPLSASKGTLNEEHARTSVERIEKEEADAIFRREGEHRFL